MSITPTTYRRNILLTALLGLALASGSAIAGDDGKQGIEKINGSITAEAGQLYGDLSTVNGSINFESGARAEDAETVNGSIKANDNITARSLSTVNGSIRVGDAAQIDKGIETVNGSIFVDRGGQIGKGVETVNGAIGLVATNVAGSIETVTGDITIGVDSHVHGGVKVNKPNSSWMPINMGSKRPPRIIIGPNAVVDGDLVFERDVTLYVHSTARIGKVTGATPVPYSTQRAPSE